MYAKWKANDVDVEEHVITFIHNDGTNRITVLAVDDNDTIPFIIPDRDGYEFAGWYTDVDLTKSMILLLKLKAILLYMLSGLKMVIPVIRLMKRLVIIVKLVML